MARRTLEQADDKTLGVLFNLAKENSDLISKVGDFENHSSVFWGLIKNPKTYKIVASLLKITSLKDWKRRLTMSL
jgi:hypothetical protein